MRSVPLFPLNTVVFPGMVVPLHVFEDRYRALVRDLRRLDSPADRVFAIPAIREGYEVGDHGVQSMHRIGTLVQLTSASANDDGTLEIEVTGRHRVRIEELHPTEEYLSADVVELVDVHEPAASVMARSARATFEQYAATLQRLTGLLFDVGEAPQDPALLSYWLAAVCPLTQRQRQDLLEAESALVRLTDVISALRQEIRAIAVLPSLPATELARTRWSPN